MKSDIKQTKNYDQFKVLDWNRNIKENNLKKIEKNYEKNGWLQHPIMVNEKFEVIDGQHRLEFAKRNNLPVYYVVIPGIGVKDCLTMNNTRTTWYLTDYINLYAEQKNDNYIILKSLLENYAFLSPTTLIGVLNQSGTGGQMLAKVKNGEYEITAKEHDKAIEKLDMLKRCARYILGTEGRASALFTAVSFAYDCPGVNKTRLEKQIKTNISIITPPANIDMAIKEVEYLYNYRGGKSNYVYIATEYKKHANERKLLGAKAAQAANAERKKDNDLCK